jgi:hypothetical protein
MIRSFCWGADAFVAIGEGVILDHEVEQMGRPQLDCGIEGLAIEGLLDRSKDAGQRLAVVLPEQRVASPQRARSRRRVSMARWASANPRASGTPSGSAVAGASRSSS